MSIDPVKIPQNVYIEDRIVGPLTLRQTIIMALGAGFSYAIYASLSKAYGPLDIVTTIIVWVPCAISVAFALVKINDLSLFRICLLSLEKFNKPAVRMWVPRRGLTIHVRTMVQPTIKELKEREQIARTEAEHMQQKIKELSQVLDQSLPGTPRPVQAPVTTKAEEKPLTPVEDDPIEELDKTEESSRPVLPVDKSRVGVDENRVEGPNLSAYQSVFRDIAPR